MNKLPPKAGVLLGVTNPFFERSCTHWPHKLSLGRHSKYDEFPPLFENLLTVNAFRVKKISAAAGPTPGWKTKTHKRYISKDRVLLKQLEDACEGNEQASMCSPRSLYLSINYYVSRNERIPSCSLSLHIAYNSASGTLGKTSIIKYRSK